MTILEEILEVKKEEVKNLKKRFTLSSFRDLEFFETKSLSFIQKAKSNGPISIIAEVKKASLSKGIIKEDFDHLRIADTYFAN